MAAGSDQAPGQYSISLGGAVLILVVVAMVCLTALLAVGMYSKDRRDADIATAEYTARTAEALAEQQRNEVMILMKQVEAMRGQLENENRRQVGGASTKKKGKK